MVLHVPTYISKHLACNYEERLTKTTKRTDVQFILLFLINVLKTYHFHVHIAYSKSNILIDLPSIQSGFKKILKMSYFISMLYCVVCVLYVLHVVHTIFTVDICMCMCVCNCMYIHMYMEIQG